MSEYWKLREVARERREQSKPPESPTEQYTYIGLENVESATGDIVGTIQKHGGDIRSVSKHFRKGDVLFSRLRPGLNKVCCPQLPAGYCSGEFIVLMPQENIFSARLLRELLSLDEIVERLVNLIAGATLPRVGLEEVLELPIPRISKESGEALTGFLSQEDQKRQAWKDKLATQRSRILDEIRERQS